MAMKVKVMTVIMKIVNSSSYGRVLPIVSTNSFTNSSTKLINDFAVCKHQKHCSGTLLL